MVMTDFDKLPDVLSRPDLRAVERIRQMMREARV